jgi:tetratricopeptide (TPR) repeat protein
MDRRQKLILAVAILTFLGAMLGAAYLSNERSGPKIDTTQRFTAKPGTTRENAVALSSSKRPSTESSTPVASATTEGELPVRSLSGTLELVPEPAAELADQALNLATPAQGLALIEEALAGDPSANSRVILETARAVLLSQLGDEKWPNAQAAFERAAAASPDSPALARVIEKHAQILIQRNELDAAEDLLNQTLARAEQDPQSSLRLTVLLGSVHELKHQPELATVAYEKVVEDLLLESETWNLQRADLARLASLRLARLYRDAGAEQEARKLARRVQARLQPDTSLSQEAL